MTRRTRGNILILAIFMAVFLFFLSVALVSQNRLDIVLALTVDDQLQSKMAARAGAQYTLAKLRQGEAIDTLEGELQDAISWESQVQPFPGPDGSPYLLELKARGHSGPVVKEHRMLLEEFSMCTQRPGQLQPHLFTYDDSGKILMMGPDFEWTTMGSPPTPDAPLIASGGPLFTFAPKGTATHPPSRMKFLQDGDPIAIQPDTEGKAMGLRVVLLEPCPPGEHLLYLKINNGVLSWEDIPDPGPQLGFWKGVVLLDQLGPEAAEIPVIRLYPENDEDEEEDWTKLELRLEDTGFKLRTANDMNENAAGEKPWEESWIDINSKANSGQRAPFEDSWEPMMSKHWDTKPWESTWDRAKTTEELTIPWDEITGLQYYLNWYSITGTGMAAQGNKVYVNGMHYYFGYPRDFKSQSMREYGQAILWDDLVFRAPCVLCYDTETEKWSIVNDMMRVLKPDEEPTIYPGPKPDRDTLAINARKEVFILEKKKRQILRVEERRLADYLSLPGDCDRKLMAYGNDLIVSWDSGRWGPNRRRKALYNLRSGEWFDPNAAFAQSFPEVHATLGPKQDDDQEQEMVTVMPASRVALSLANPVSSSWDNDFYCPVWIRRESDPPQFPPLGYFSQLPREDYHLTIARFDGKFWQLWPQGLRGQLLYQPSQTGPEATFEARDEAGQVIRVRPTELAVGAYATGRNPARRYAIVQSLVGQAAP